MQKIGMMEYKVDKNFLIKLGKINKNVEKEIIKKFPNIFDDDKKYCYVGQILVSKTTDSFYTIVEIDNNLKILNITHSNFWKNSVKKPYKSCVLYPDKDIVVTKGMFIEMLGINKYRYDDFVPIDAFKLLKFKQELINNLDNNE